MKISIVTPVYFNGPTLPKLFAELKKVEAKLKSRYILLEIIFVDDGSKDDSLEKLILFKGKSKNIKIVKLTKNFGSMAAIRAGLNFVTGDAFTLLAADLQEPPELIINMVDKWLGGFKYIVCARKERKDPLFTRFFSGFYYILLRALVVQDYPTGGYDLSLMDKALLPFMQKSGKSVNLLLYAHSLGFKREIIYYKRRQRDSGKSMWTFSKKLNFFIDSILGSSILPLRYISLVGVITSIGSFVYGFYIIINALSNSIPIPGWASLAVLISMLMGLVIFMLGMIGEYIWRIYNELNGTPDAVIDEIF
ncbi:glycosyltransferase family 2 protein [Methylophilaceae bacterium]|nr:glycosyltransferase family 2 protein [Methylophilaceae bacterium]